MSPETYNLKGSKKVILFGGIGFGEPFGLLGMDFQEAMKTQLLCLKYIPFV